MTTANHERSCAVALSIAGSDNSAGAGIQADLKTFAAHGVYGLTAVTCVVAEVPGLVSATQVMPVKLIQEQIRLCKRAFPVRAVKTGMLFSREIIHAVAEMLQGTVLVVDPVMVASSGAPLLEKDAVLAYREKLFPLATVVTPNLDEAQVIAGMPIADVDALEKVGRILAGRYGTAFLMKGGHFRSERAVDLLVQPNGTMTRYESEFVADVETHGSGCTFSAAITAGLARGEGLAEAVRGAKKFITEAMVGHHRWSHDGVRTDALNHLARVERYSGS